MPSSGTVAGRICIRCVAHGAAGRADARLSCEHAALSFISERLQCVRGEPMTAGFAPLSRTVACANGGWARTHGGASSAPV